MLDNIKILPDPHIGRKFVTGVPLHRLGEREKSQMKDLICSLQLGEKEYHVCVGDIFDKFVVPNHVLLMVFGAYAAAAKARPDRKFFILRGNHDASRDASKVSSFDLLKLLLSPYENITVIDDTPATFGPMGFIPWHPFKTSAEMAEEFISMFGDQRFEVIFGHWDVQSFGDKTQNLIPTKILSKATDLIVTGHIHIPGEFERDGLRVVVSGSMQPYSHAEDPEGRFYKTLTLTEFQNLQPDDYKDLNLRLLLSPGQDLPTVVDCLSLTSKRLVEDEEGEQVDIEEFMNLDLGGLLAKRLAGNPVADQIMRHFNADETVS